MFNRDYNIGGKHADYIKYLTATSEGLTLGKSAKIFDFGYQVLFIAPLIGLAYDIRPDIDETETMEFTVKAIQMVRNKETFDKVYKMVLLADRSREMTPDERIDFVFRPDEDEKEKSDELFNSYTRGGIEWLYYTIVKDGGSEEDYLNNIIDAINKFTVEFAVYEDVDVKVKEIEAEYS